MVRHEIQHTALVSMFGNHTNLICHAVIVGN